MISYLGRGDARLSPSLEDLCGGTLIRTERWNIGVVCVLDDQYKDDDRLFESLSEHSAKERGFAHPGYESNKGLDAWLCPIIMSLLNQIPHFISNILIADISCGILPSRAALIFYKGLVIRFLLLQTKSEKGKSRAIHLCWFGQRRPLSILWLSVDDDVRFTTQ